MTITQDEAVQIARECGQNWQYFGYRQTSMVVTLDELTVFANLACQRGLIEAEAKVKELEALNDFDAKRLRVLTNLLGMSVPESDETLLACAGTVLGTMRRVIENMFKKGNEQEAKIAELEARLDQEINHHAGLMSDLRHEVERVEELRVKKFARFNNEDCWIYQGDGEDHLESLTCPVVISPKVLMELQARLEGEVVWNPINTAPKNNKRLLYLARFNEANELVELDFNGTWEYWQESWEMAHINGWTWVSENGIEEPTHWSYQDCQLPTTHPKQVEGEPASFQGRVKPWMTECFGPEISSDKVERNHRFFEEATELVQSTGMTRSECHQLVDYTYDRPVGDPVQETGGVMVTLAAHNLAHGINMHEAGELELARISKPEVITKIRAKQAAKPKHSPLPVYLNQSADAKDAGDLQDLVSKAMNKAWQLGQTYWQQADSEFYSQNKKSDDTHAKFQALVDETRSAISAERNAKS